LELRAATNAHRGINTGRGSEFLTETTEEQLDTVGDMNQRINETKKRHIRRSTDVENMINTGRLSNLTIETDEI